MPDKSHILLIGGELHVRELLGEFLDKLGFVSHAVDNLATALSSAAIPESFAALIDVGPLDRIRLDEITMLRHESPAIRIIIMTGNPTLELLLEGIRIGISDVVIKPFRYEELREVLSRAEILYDQEKGTLSLRERISELEDHICHLENAKAVEVDGIGDVAGGTLSNGQGMSTCERPARSGVCGTGAGLELLVTPAGEGRFGTTRCCVGQRGY